VDLTLSKRGDYVLRAAISLGRVSQSGEFRKIREVAEEMGLPERYTPHILNLLLKAGIAESRAGQKGGYRLVRPPAAISLLEVVEAGEGQLWPRRCTLSGGPCHWQEICAVHPAWEDAHRALSDSLGRTSLESILAVDRSLESGQPPVAARTAPESTWHTQPGPPN
jgi:Rrf2 family iron-sulfur cluster assembly transcriptional regulator